MFVVWVASETTETGIVHLCLESQSGWCPRSGQVKVGLGSGDF